MTGTALVTRNGGAVAPADFTLDESMRLAEVLAGSGFFSDARGAAQAVTKMLAGRELGVGPIASMTGVNIIKGKVTLSANLMASAIKRHPRYTFRVKQLDETGCVLDFYEDGECIGTSSFSDEDARKAGLGGDMYRKFPRNMYFSRALSNGAKWYTPDVFGGPVYTPDELGAEVNEEGEYVDPHAAQLPRPLPAPTAPAQPPATAPVPPAPSSPNPTPAPAPPAPPAPTPIRREPDKSLPPAAEAAPERVTDALLGDQVDGPPKSQAQRPDAREPATTPAPPTFEGTDTDRVGPIDAKNLTDYLRDIGAGRQFVNWALIDAGVQNVGDPHEALGRLTKAQAKLVVASAAAKYAT